MSNGGRYDPGPLPKRWLKCPRKTATLIIDKFLAFKCPLSAKFDEKVPPECQFHPEMLLEFCRKRKIKLGLWIDLTNTDRFYSDDVIKKYDCTYVKMKCRGHGEAPSVEQTYDFIQLVHNFIAQHPLHAIGVHCTHGFNRTGFLIVSYLVMQLDMSLEIALKLFADARPPGIYKVDYIRELYQRHDDIDDAPPAPALPDWCFDESDDFDDDEGNDNDVNEQGESSSSSSQQFTKSKKRKRFGKQAEFMVNIPEIREFTEEPQATILRKKVQEMCEWKGRDFPGSQPVSMDMNNIKFLSQKPYRVSWKADGTRYMMLIDGIDKVYFFDRDYNIFNVRGLRFPHRQTKKHLENTLLDGEMVIDKVGDENIPRYLAYDIIQYDKQPVGRLSFYPKRLEILEMEVIRPRHQAIMDGMINKANEPISIRNKQFWDVTQAANLLGEKFAASLPHEPDGLIFQPSNEPYCPGRCDEVLKWKPLNMNSVDFKLKIIKQGGMGMIPTKMAALFVGTRNNMDPPFACMKYTKDLKELEGKIVECKFEDKRWVFMRERKDKSYPNSYETAMAVCGSIENPVTQEFLIDYISLHKFSDDSTLMGPPKCPRR